MDVRGELPGHALVWQPRAGQWVATIIVKATFDLVPGEAKLSSSQELLALTDSFWDGDATRSLASASDLVPTKALADVVLTGHAYPPPGKPARRLVARLAFEDIDKSIEVDTDRSVGPDGTIYQGNRWTRMPLVYERAAGGPGTWNPVGVHKGSRDAYGRTPLPNLVPVGYHDDPANFPEAVGFGPIAANWPSRAERLTFHPTPTSAHLAQKPLPDGFDKGWFNVAPIDQQLAELPVDGHLLLENLSPAHSVLTVSFPGVRPRVVAERRGGASEGLKMRADTMTIDTDRALVTMVWRGQLALSSAAESCVIRVDVDRPRASWRTMTHENPGNETMAIAPGHLPSFGHKAAATIDTTEARRLAAQAALPFAGASKGPDTRKANREALPFVGPSSATRAMPAQGPPAGLPFRAGADDPAPPISQPITARPHSEVTSTSLQPQLTPLWSAALSPHAVAPSSSSSFARGFGSRPATEEPPAPPAPSFGAPPAPATHPPPLAPPAHHPAPVAIPAARATPPSTASRAADTPWGPAVPPPAVMKHAGTAALGGLVTASNAAADPSARAGTMGTAPRRIDGDVLHLLWFNPEIVPRIRRKPEWKTLLDALETSKPDPELDEAGLAEDPAELEDRREVFEIVARGTPTGQDSVDHALLGAVRADGRFAPQLLLLTGELRFDFDELELLKATVSAATPFGPNDEELKKVLDSTTEFLASPDLVTSPDVSTAMTRRVREAFAVSSRPVPATYLDEQTERALLDRRAYQKRNVFGAPQLRALLFFAGSDSGIPTYLPEELGKKLPLFRRLRVRTLVEAQFQADQYETHSAALRAVALARIVR